MCSHTMRYDQQGGGPVQTVRRATVIVLIALTGSVICAALCILPSLSVEAVPASAEGLTLFDAPVQATSAPVEFMVEIIRPSAVPETVQKRILIYHTHTWEAYTKTADRLYVETERWRTKDNTANVVAVGAALQTCLEVMGYEVVHDTTAFEPPDLSTAYTRSLTMLEKRIADGETYDLYIDLHRDAFDDPNAILRTVNIAGEDVARFMVLVGKGTGFSGAGYALKPDWEKNFAVAELITNALNDQADRLARDICLRTGRFNQHVANGCVLIECGNNHNTLEEVLGGIPYLAEAIHRALQKAQ